MISADVVTSNARPLRNANSLRGDAERDRKSIKNINWTESKPCHMYPPVPSEMRFITFPLYYVTSFNYLTAIFTAGLGARRVRPLG